MTHSSDMPDFNDVFAALWRRIHWIALASFAGAVLALIIAFSSKQLFQSDSMVVPVADYGQQLGSSSLGGVGGLASLAGIELGSKDAKQVKRIEYLTSRNFLMPFIEQHQLKRYVFPERWDNESKQWLPPFWGKRLYAWLLGRELQNEPSLLDAYELFLRDHVRVDEDAETGFLTLIVWMPQPALAQQTLQQLIDSANKQLSESERAQVERRIAYLEQEADKARLSEIKTALYSLLEAEYKQLMVANIARDYAFEVLESPQLPERLAKPSKVLYAIAGAFLGFVLAIAAILLIQRPKQAQ